MAINSDLNRLLVEQQLKSSAQKKSSKARSSLSMTSKNFGKKSWGKILRLKSESREIVPCALNASNGVSRRHSLLMIFWSYVDIGHLYLLETALYNA